MGGSETVRDAWEEKRPSAESQALRCGPRPIGLRELAVWNLLIKKPPRRRAPKTVPSALSRITMRNLLSEARSALGGRAVC